jgi:hypothetical protein
MVDQTLKGPFRIWYKNKPVRVTEDFKWEWVKDPADATTFSTFEAARSNAEAVDFAQPKDAEIAPLAYRPEDSPAKYR